jgi:hypothetical protein
MATLKNFLYLDEYKMYSLSSQIFEGITEYLISNKTQAKEDYEDQKGPFGSGRIIADIIREESQIQEKRFLHDFSYHVFESHLQAQGKVKNIDKDSVEEFKEEDAENLFVRVKARGTFNDTEIIRETVAGFNKLGEAFARGNEPTGS